MDDRSKLEILISFNAFIQAMEFSKDEMGQWTSILNHSFFGLNKENLIETFIYGNGEDLKKRHGISINPPTGGGILARPSAVGCELFLWAHGYGSSELSSTLHLPLAIPPGMKVLQTVLSLEDMKPKSI